MAAAKKKSSTKAKSGGKRKSSTKAKSRPRPAAGRSDKSVEAFRDALDRHRRMSARPWTARTQGELARLLRTRRGPGDRDEATELIAQARRTAKALDMRTLAADLSALG